MRAYKRPLCYGERPHAWVTWRLLGLVCERCARCGVARPLRASAGRPYEGR